MISASISLEVQMPDDKKFYVINWFTGKPFDVAGDGTDMKGMFFETEEEMKEFVAAHWLDGAVEMVPDR